MSHEAISTALHAADSSGEPRLIAKSSYITWPVWRMLKVLRHCPDALGDDLFLTLRHIGLAPAMEPVLGLDPAEQQVLRAAGAEDEGFDPRDLHGGLPLPSIRVIPAKALAYAHILIRQSNIRRPL